MFFYLFKFKLNEAFPFSKEFTKNLKLDKESDLAKSQ